jgi:hypothetical protein
MQRTLRISLFQDVFRSALCGLCVKLLLLIAAMLPRVLRGCFFAVSESPSLVGRVDIELCFL